MGLSNCWMYSDDQSEREGPLYIYEDQCVITLDEWYDNPWEVDHFYYEYYNNLDLACFYANTDDYSTCYAYFRVPDENRWEFTAGGLSHWNVCETFDDTYAYNCY